MTSGHALAMSVLCGAGVAVGWPVATASFLIAALVAASIGIAVESTRCRQALLLLAVAAVVGAHAARARDETLAPSVARWFAGTAGGAAGVRGVPEPVRLRGVVGEDAARTVSGSIRFRLGVTAVWTSGRWREVSGPVQLFVQGATATGAYGDWTRGRLVETTAVLRWPPVLRNPGSGQPNNVRLARPYALVGTVKSAMLVAATPASPWFEWAAWLRRRVRQSTERAFGSDDYTAAVVTAILIGDRTGLDPATTERLVAAGTYHVIAISGGNVALVALLTVAIFRRLSRWPRVAPAGALGAILIYGWIVGGEPSVLRAVTAAVIVFGADVAGLRPAPIRVFSLATVLVVLADPLIVVKAGAWLSFGATLGILVVADRLLRRGAQGGAPPTWTSRLRRGLLALGAATVSAELMLLPVAAWMFSRVSVAGFGLNYLAIPAMAVVQLAGAAVVAGDLLAPVLVPWAAAVARLAAGLLVESARVVDWMPGLAWRVPPPPSWLLIAYYMALAAALSGRVATWSRGWSKASVAALLVVIATGPETMLTKPRPGVLRITVLDVGQGDSTLIQFPTGHVMVVDAGSATDTFDTGARVVTPALWALGTRRVDWVAFSHADLDHIGGVEAVVREFSAREVWEGVPVAADAAREALRRGIGPLGVAWRQLRAGDRLTLGRVEVEVLHPPKPDWERPQVRNDDSVVLRLRYGQLDVLLPGDISEGIERTIDVEAEAARAVRILKVAHHGSRSSTDPVLLRRFRPSVAVVSAGRNNTFGHPAPEVVTSLQAHGVTVLRTDRDGAVMIESDGDSVHVQTWNGRTWSGRVLPPS